LDLHDPVFPNRSLVSVVLRLDALLQELLGHFLFAKEFEPQGLARVVAAVRIMANSGGSLGLIIKAPAGHRLLVSFEADRVLQAPRPDIDRVDFLAVAIGDQRVRTLGIEDRDRLPLAALAPGAVIPLLRVRRMRLEALSDLIGV